VRVTAAFKRLLALDPVKVTAVEFSPSMIVVSVALRNPQPRPKSLVQFGQLFLTAQASHKKPHHRPSGVRAGNLGESRGGEHCHGTGEDGGRSNPSSAQGRHIDGMTLDGGRSVLASELDGRPEER
jgi:hypothetical protein